MPREYYIPQVDGPRSRSAPDTLPEDQLAAALMRMMRTTNFTAAEPAHIKPNVWSQPVDVSGQVSMPAAVNNTYQTIASYRPPPGHYARIKFYGVQVTDATYTYDGTLEWRVNVNGIPVTNLEGFTEQRGSISSPRETIIILRDKGPSGVRNLAGDLVEIQVRRPVAAGGVLVTQAALSGWIWPLRNTYEGTQASVTAF